MQARATDILIRGAGPVGCTLALALQGTGLRVVLLEKKEPTATAFRPIALSYASRLILERVGVWDVLAASTIETVQVSQLGAFGRTQLSAQDAGVPALGYVVEYASLALALRARLAAARVETVADEITAKCVVHAEGSTPDAVERRYTQHAIVALVQFNRASATTAYERFTPQGPLAMLPLAGRYALIWSTHPERARELTQAGEMEFLHQLSMSAGRQAGIPVQLISRSVQPLVSRLREARVQERAVFIGNAAQTLHPVAGQGLNLGLRDAWDLAQTLRESTDPGESATLSRYAARRRIDAAVTFRVTDLLARGFVGDGRIASAARGAALTALDILPLPRRFFARRMIYGPSALP